ncbi:ABC transporter permease [Paramagnetospirillum kuznetsovii]|uniref:ABC transporter permease n=1 Tax=Paramagnetospirillum kuznetsovii TaxID=2053833 RepID=A0A364NZJ0_9PROT|nr:ABC transporter substrate-binding protein [Paramagnetospirillum kuznetsovii]RAU22486.1 ABC transporter permease [Paramagnetospirillum kuznetsovii]
MIRTLGVVALTVFAVATAMPVQAQQVVKLGILTDMSGPYSDMGGPGSVAAAQMAIDECLAAECKGMKIELLSADHQNKADIGAQKAREWADVNKVNAIADLTNSAVALGVQKLTAEHNFVAMYSGPATTKLTNEECSATGFHWMFDTYALAAGSAQAITKMGGKSWYFVTVDYAFGHSLEADAMAMVKSLGGTVAGSIRHPLNAPDMSSFLLSAQSSPAGVIALANGAADTINAIKTAREFGIVASGKRVVPLLIFLSDIRSLGLDIAQGLTFTEGFYWDQDDAARAMSAKFQKAFQDRKPTMVQAGVYSSVLHYLRSVAAAKTTESKAVAAKMREMPINDAVMRHPRIRPDGRVVHDMLLVKVKTPAESKGGWDFYSIQATIPAEEAFKPLAGSACPLVKN